MSLLTLAAPIGQFVSVSPFSSFYFTARVHLVLKNKRKTFPHLNLIELTWSKREANNVCVDRCDDQLLERKSCGIQEGNIGDHFEQRRGWAHQKPARRANMTPFNFKDSNEKRLQQQHRHQWLPLRLDDKENTNKERYVPYLWLTWIVSLLMLLSVETWRQWLVKKSLKKNFITNFCWINWWTGQFCKWKCVTSNFPSHQSRTFSLVDMHIFTGNIWMSC